MEADSLGRWGDLRDIGRPCSCSYDGIKSHTFFLHTASICQSTYCRSNLGCLIFRRRATDSTISCVTTTNTSSGVCIWFTRKPISFNAKAASRGLRKVAATISSNVARYSTSIFNVPSRVTRWWNVLAPIGVSYPSTQTSAQAHKKVAEKERDKKHLPNPNLNPPTRNHTAVAGGWCSSLGCQMAFRRCIRLRVLRSLGGWRGVGGRSG